jgi:hypothetical protein
MKNWKTLETRTLFHNQWFDIREEKVQITDELAIEGVIVHRFPDWCNVIAMTPDHQIFLVRQYRHGIGKDIIETPSGSQEPADKNPQEAAERELLEETGYFSNRWIALGQSYANPQLQNNMIHHYLALDCRLIAQPQAELGGTIDFWTEPMISVMEKIRAGVICHSSVIEGIFRAKDWLKTYGSDQI